MDVHRMASLSTPVFVKRKLVWAQEITDFLLVFFDQIRTRPSSERLTNSYWSLSPILLPYHYQTERIEEVMISVAVCY